MGMYGSRAVTLIVLISDDVINRILKLDIQTNILIYVTRCCIDLTSKVLKGGGGGGLLASRLLYYELLNVCEGLVHVYCHCKSILGHGYVLY